MRKPLCDEVIKDAQALLDVVIRGSHQPEREGIVEDFDEETALRGIYRIDRSRRICLKCATDTWVFQRPVPRDKCYYRFDILVGITQ